MTRGTTARTWVLCATGILISISSAILFVLSLGERVPEEFGTVGAHLLEVAVSVCILLLGTVIAVRQPRNPIGWLLVAAALAFSVGAFCGAYALRGLITAPGSLPGSDVAGWASQWTWPVGFTAIPLVLLLFPDGRPLSRGWWIVGGLAGAAVLLTIGPIAAVMWQRRGVQLFLDPNETGGLDAGLPFFVSAAIFFLSATALAAIHLILRFRRVRGEQRLQLKWLATAGIIWASFVLVDTLTNISSVGIAGELLSIVLFLFIPLAVAIAILRYRLYDIDVVINKTLVFGALAAFITGIYVAVVVGIGALLGSSDEPNLVLSIAATAIVAIAFQPVKERVQRIANRLVYGQRSTPYEVMANLSRAASGAVEPRAILPSVAAVAASGVGARATRVSLVLHSGEALAATHPEEVEGDVRYDVEVPLTHRDEVIGELAVAKAAGEQLSPGDTKLLEDLAAQAALALHNARLAIELGARLDEISVQAQDLDASRRRIVSAQDDSRRRLERDISSGPQRSLEQMRVELAIIKETLGDDRERAAGLLAVLAGRANQTLDALRDLARGIFPPLLADKGIVAALEAHIRKHELDVDLQTDEGVRAARFEERVEIAVYFCCLEVLASRSARTVLALEVKDGELEMSCSGVKLDDARRETIRDRVEALAGTVLLGEGGGLRARFPVAVLEAAG